jgi:hypothetical protein
MHDSEQEIIDRVHHISAIPDEVGAKQDVESHIYHLVGSPGAPANPK